MRVVGSRGDPQIWEQAHMTTPEPAAPARKASVLVVEDEVMIRMMVTDMLVDLGHSIAAEAGEIDEALRLAESADFDLAILDVNVNGKTIEPVAKVVERRKVPL